MERAALITGASTGIGLALAKRFAKDGHNVVLTARSAERLENAAREIEQSFQVSTKVLPADLSDPHAPRTVFDACEQENIEVQFLVNNAGFGLNGKFAQLDLGEQLDMIQLNVTALVHLTGLFLPKMLERNRGRIMNIASTAAFQPGPTMAVYYATKAFVLSFGEAVANELRGSNVTLTTVCPGPTTTGFQDRAGAHDMPMLKSPMIKVMSADEVAQIGYDAFLKGKSVVIPGIFNLLGAQSVRFMPRAVVTEAARRMTEIK